MLESLLERYRQRDRQALSRLLSHVARGEHGAEILAGIRPPPAPSQGGETQPAPPSKGGERGGSRVVAITGSAGVGKSTLVGKLIELVRRQGKTVAVLACDPQSPLTGGALLGDRFRMPSQPDDGVFIRSLSAAAGQGALARNLDAMVRLLEGFGFDVIFLETVGAGQGDTAVRDLADVVVLLVQPETGDDLQWEKAGVLEVSDVVAIHKADLPGAEQAEAQVRATLGLSAGQAAPVVRVSAKKGEGLEQLWSVIGGLPLRRPGAAADGRELLRLAQETLTRRFAAAEAARDPALREVVARWQQGRPDRGGLIGELLRLLVPKDDYTSRGQD